MDNISSQDILNLKESTDNLSSKVSIYNLELLNNFSFILSNLSSLYDKITITKNIIETFTDKLTPEYKNFLNENLVNLRNLYTNMSTTISIDVILDLDNFIYYDIFDSNFNLIFSKANIKATGVQNKNIFLCNIDVSNLDDDLYYVKIYNQTNNIFNLSNVIQYSKNSDNYIERYLFNNTENIAVDLKNYRVVVKDSNNNILGTSIIINSTITDEHVDIQLFSLFKDFPVNISDYTFEISEQLFDDVFVELKLVDYDINDVGNVLLGNADRNLIDGTFTVYDKQGNVSSKMVSTRYGSVEERKKLS